MRPLWAALGAGLVAAILLVLSESAITESLLSSFSSSAGGDSTVDAAAPPNPTVPPFSSSAASAAWMTPRLSQNILAVSQGARLVIDHGFGPAPLAPRVCALYYTTHTGSLVPPLLVWNATAAVASTTQLVCNVPPVKREPIAFDVWRYPMEYGAATPYMGGPYILFLNNTANASDFASWPMTLYVASDNVTVERPLAHGGFPRGCNASDYTSLRALLNASQFPAPSRCPSLPWLRHDLSNTGIGMNIVAFLHQTVRSALRLWHPADNDSLPLVALPQQPAAWRYSRQCARTLAYDCLFGPVFSCAPPSLSPALDAPRAWRLNQPVYAPPRVERDRANPWLQRCGETAVAAAIVAQFTPTRPDLREEFARRVEQLHAGPKHGYECIAVHVRQGERGTNKVKWGLKFMPRYSLEDVARLVRPLSRAVGVRDVVFATDGTDLLEEARTYNGSDLVFHVSADIKRAVDGSDCLRESVVGCTPGLSPEDVRFALLLDLEALSNCKWFVGTMRSTFTKLAFLRALGNGVAVHDGISLD